MLTYKKLPKETRAEMERLGRLQGVNPAEIEQQHDKAQVAIHDVSPYDNNDILMRGFKKRGRGA